MEKRIEELEEKVVELEKQFADAQTVTSCELQDVKSQIAMIQFMIKR
ncbi:hypothetical protein ACNFJN_04570 [Xenorhabdus budapestensis]|uniref:Transposase n=1 Tax=Xenorhabdus budapestensis TaxID=290110 RepID=A0ABX7VJ37_XENBU|nr:hypothetical protein [Xenorhabdus budapestensis]QTL40583.1 hypothetical protein HGO23_04110 [Xenorhabdus budapestensis]